MLSPALVTMQSELNTTAHPKIGLSQTVFFTSAALFSLFLPRLADLMGRKKVLMGMLLFTVAGCTVSALAPNVTVLLVGRLLQGAAGPIVTLCIIMLHVRVPDEKQYTKLMAVITSVNGGIAGVDAIAGGWIAGTWGYRPIFWTMAVIGIASTILVGIFADESVAEGSQNERMDWLGVIFLVVAVGTALTAVNSMQHIAEVNWMFVGILLAIALAAFVTFWAVERKSSHPLSPVHYLKQRRTWGSAAYHPAVFNRCVCAIMNGVVPAIAQDSECGAGVSASISSFFTLTPYAIIGLIFGPIAGILATKFGYLKSVALRTRHQCSRRCNWHLRCAHTDRGWTAWSLSAAWYQLRRYRQYYAKWTWGGAFAKGQHWLFDRLQCGRIQPWRRHKLHSAVWRHGRILPIERYFRRICRQYDWRCGSAAARPRMLVPDSPAGNFERLMQPSS